MILILGGTADAREIAGALQHAGHAVLLSVVSEYAGELAAGVPVRAGALDQAALRELVQSATSVIDATHPFAQEISRLAIAVCAELGVSYLRFERAESTLPSHIHLVDGPAQGASRAVELARGGAIFLTVGSKTLAPYVIAARKAGCRLVARVLPTVASVTECERAGLQPCDIIAMQGPTCAELDAALLRFFVARVLVTKESGPTGGVMEKVSAAEAVGIPVVVVGRPRVEYPRVVRSVDEILECLNHDFQD